MIWGMRPPHQNISIILDDLLPSQFLQKIKLNYFWADRIFDLLHWIELLTDILTDRQLAINSFFIMRLLSLTSKFMDHVGNFMEHIGNFIGRLAISGDRMESLFDINFKLKIVIDKSKRFVYVWHSSPKGIWPFDFWN